MAPNDHLVIANQAHGNNWAAVVKKRRGKSVRHKTIINRGLDGDSAASTSQDRPGLKPTAATTTLQRGLSNDHHNLGCLTQDATCRQLLQAAVTDSGRLDAVIIAAVLETRDCDLVPDTTADECPQLIRNHVHYSGDVYTAVNIVRWRLTDERKKGCESLAKWCRTLRVNHEALAAILDYIKDFRRLLDPEDKEDDRVLQSRNPQIVETLSRVLQDTFCVYLGHPDLGYQNVRTKQIIPVCPASSLHLLLEMPRYIVSHPRHLHMSLGNCQTCHYLTVVSDEQGEFFLKTELFLRQLDSEKDLFQAVTLVHGIDVAGVQSTRRLCKLWDDTESDTTRRLRSQFGDAPVVLDSKITLASNRITVFAYEYLHAQVRSFVAQEIRLIKDELEKEKVVLSLPKVKRGFQVVLERGFVVETAVFPFDSTPKLDEQVRSEEDIFKQHERFVEFKNTVHLSLQIGDLVHDGCEEDRVLRSTALVKHLLADLNDKQWGIEYTGTEEGLTEMDLVFHNAISARRAIAIINDLTALNLPIWIINEPSAKTELLAVQLHVHHKVMRVVGDEILSQVQNFQQSSEHKICKDDQDNTIIQLYTNDHSHLHRITERLSALLRPSAVVVPPHKVRYLATKEGQFCVDKIARQTDTFIHYSLEERCLSVYGTPSAKKKGCGAVEDFLSARSAGKTWHCIASSWESLNGLAPDFLLTLNSRIQKHQEKLAPAERREVEVDLVNNEIWLFADKTETPKVTRQLETLASESLKNDYGRSRNIKFSTKYDNELSVDCVVCYSPTVGTPYVMESCGHVYCRECLKTQLSTAVANTQLPIQCAECCCGFTIADLTNIAVSLRVCSLNKLLKSCVRVFLRTHQEDYKACLALDCDGICKFHKYLNVYICGTCPSRLCPLCLERFHKGMSCEEYRKSQLSIDTWMNAQKNRKKCPSCKTGIEKYDGCNKIHCVHCNKEFCWVCLKVFENVYAHMDETGHWSGD